MHLSSGCSVYLHPSRTENGAGPAAHIATGRIKYAVGPHQRYQSGRKPVHDALIPTSG